MQASTRCFERRLKTGNDTAAADTASSVSRTPRTLLLPWQRATMATDA